MAYIAPNSIVELFGDIGLNDNYTDTYYFPNEATKTTYFNNLTKVGVSATPLSYNRENRNEVKLELPMSQIYNAAYMRFKNTSFENKWFYAFIDNVEYISNNCTCVHYHLDPMMTWMGVFHLNECFVERQHTITDGIGENLVEENLDTGEYIVQATYRTNYFDSYTICIFQSTNDQKVPTGSLRGGLYTGAYIYEASSVSDANTHLANYVDDNTKDNIIMIMMLPTDLLDTSQWGDNHPVQHNHFVPAPYTDIDGYVPKNKKLFCYPYNFLVVYNSEGDTATYRYEFFDNPPSAVNSIPFKIYGNAGLEPEIMCVPYNYKGVANAYAEKISMSNFPKCSWNVDAYKAYLAQMQSSLPVNLISNGLKGFAGAIIGGISNTGNTESAMSSGGTGIIQQAGVSMLNAVTNVLGLKIAHPTMGTENRGHETNDLLVGLGDKDFYFYETCVTREYARILDNYFDMYGYAIKRRQIPNMHARQYWTYVKTIGCQVSGNLPSDDASTIESIFNNGIRFWQPPATIGDYTTYDNSVS